MRLRITAKAIWTRWCASIKSNLVPVCVCLLFLCLAVWLHGCLCRSCLLMRFSVPQKGAQWISDPLERGRSLWNWSRKSLWIQRPASQKVCVCLPGIPYAMGTNKDCNTSTFWPYGDIFLVPMKKTVYTLYCTSYSLGLDPCFGAWLKKKCFAAWLFTINNNNKKIGEYQISILQ